MWCTYYLLYMLAWHLESLNQSFHTTNWSQNGLLQAPHPNVGQSPQMFLCAFEILCLSDGVITFLRDIIIFSNSRARWFRIHLPLFQRAEFTKHMGIHFMTWGLLCGWATKDEHCHGHGKVCQIVFSVFWQHVLHQNLTCWEIVCQCSVFPR